MGGLHANGVSRLRQKASKAWASRSRPSPCLCAHLYRLERKKKEKKRMSLAEQAFQLPWSGIHHIALLTTDLDATIRFYRDVLGMPTSEIFPSKEGRGRHCLIFVKPNDDNVR